jgi:enterochelin esterase-like enzyme
MLRPLRGRVDVTTIESRLLEGNLLGDPSRRELLAYLPPDYDARSDRYPTVMILPGFGSNHRSLLGYDIWKPNLVERFEALVVNGDCPPAILVLPDAITTYGGSQFVDSTVTGLYQSYLAEEVVAHVDATYRTIPEREARAVAGRSSGGFGALRLAMDRSDLFSVVGSHAGDALFEVTLRPMFLPAALAFDRAGGVEAFARRIAETGPRGSDFDALFFLAAAMAYAPEPERPLPHAALPFDARTGDPVPDVWARFLAHDPVLRAPLHADALRSLRLVYVDAGNVDEYGAQLAARKLDGALRAAGAQVVFEEFEGGHRGTSHRYDASLPRLVSALAR